MTTPSKLILFDLDNTLIQGAEEYYRDPSVKAAFREALHSGAVIGLCTNRTLAGSEGVHKTLELNGPLIIENGAIAYIPQPDKGHREDVLAPASSKNLAQSTQESLVRLFAESDTEYQLLSKRAGHQEIPPHGLAVSLSDDRRHSLSLYVYDNGQPSPEWAGRIHDSLAPAMREQAIIVEHGPVAGKLHIYPQTVSKTSSALKVQATYWPNSRVFLVGDNETDERSYNNQIHYLGVKDSSQQYVRFCEYVADKAKTEGIRELLSYTK